MLAFNKSMKEFRNLEIKMVPYRTSFQNIKLKGLFDLFLKNISNIFDKIEIHICICSIIKNNKYKILI